MIPRRLLSGAKFTLSKTVRGTKYGNSKRISNYLENRSSQTQKLESIISSSTTWSINASLTGKYKEVFEASVGGGWANTSSFSQIITMNVGSNKKMWLEFKPLLRYVSGKSQKYYIPRGPVNKKPIIVESKSVYSTSPKSITVPIVVEPILVVLSGICFIVSIIALIKSVLFLRSQ